MKKSAAARTNPALVRADLRIAEIARLQEKLAARVAGLREAAAEGRWLDDLSEIEAGLRDLAQAPAPCDRARFGNEYPCTCGGCRKGRDNAL